MKSIILVLTLLLPLLSFGQYLGGYYEVDQTGNSQYDFELTTVTNASSSLNHCYAEIQIWDPSGSTLIDLLTVPRINGAPNSCDSITHQGQVLSPTILLNKYTVSYSFSAPGTYLLRYSDGDFDSQIVNVAAGQAFSFEAVLYVNSLMGANSLASFLNEPIQVICNDPVSIFNPGWFDSEGDSLGFQLFPISGGNPLTVYSDTSTLDPNTGVLQLVNPFVGGWYAYLIEQKEYRNGNLVGQNQWISALVVTDTCAYVGLDEVQDKSAFTIYPNPSDGLIQINSTLLNSGGVVEFYSTHGQVLKRFDFDQLAGAKVEISEFETGVYFVKIEVGKKVEWKRVVRR